MTCTTALSMTQVSDTWYALPGGAYAPSLIIRLHDAVSELLILGVEFALYGADDKVGHPARMEVEQLCASSLPRMPLVTCYGGMILSAANTKECPENRHTAISSVTGVFSPDFLISGVSAERHALHSLKGETHIPAGHFRLNRHILTPQAGRSSRGGTEGKASLCPPTAEGSPRYWTKRIPCRRSTSAESERSRIRLLPVSMRPMASMSSSSRAKSVTERFSCSLSE